MIFRIGSVRELGVRWDNFQSLLLPYFILAIILSVGLLLFLKVFTDFGLSSFALWHRLYPSWVFVLPLSALQELFFRGYLMLVLKRLSQNAAVVILVDAALFGAMHLIFPYASVLVPMTFLGGICFAYVYYYYPNVILSWLAHTAVLLAMPLYCSMHLVYC